MWKKNKIIRFPQIKNLFSSLILSKFFRFKNKKLNVVTRGDTRKVQHNIITIIIANNSSGKLSLKESKHWSGQTGIYKIPQDINPGELVTFDLRKNSLKNNQGVVVYQIIDSYKEDYLLIIGWLDFNSINFLNHAFIKLMLMKDYQQTNFENIQTSIEDSKGQSYSMVNGYSACAKVITRGSLPLWVNYLQ